MLARIPLKDCDNNVSRQEAAGEEAGERRISFIIPPNGRLSRLQSAHTYRWKFETLDR